MEESYNYEEERKRLILGRLRKIENGEAVVLPQRITTFRVIAICLIGNILTGLFELKNGYELEKIDEVCGYFKSSLSSSESFNSASNFLVLTSPDILSTNKKELLAPIQSCTQKILTLTQSQSDYSLERSHFLETSSAKIIQQLLNVE